VAFSWVGLPNFVQMNLASRMVVAHIGLNMVK
jgi:hypothetical protein